MNQKAPGHPPGLFRIVYACQLHVRAHPHYEAVKAQLSELIHIGELMRYAVRLADIRRRHHGLERLLWIDVAGRDLLRHAADLGDDVSGETANAEFQSL
jgi:hypothetical protein